jgi:hypothetical protein
VGKYDAGFCGAMNMIQLRQVCVYVYEMFPLP